MQTTVYTVAYYTLSTASLITALGLPANAVIQGVTWEAGTGQLTIQAAVQNSQTGTP